MKNLIPLTAAIAASFAIVIGGAVSTAAAESGNNAQVFYVALGDSVATGAQPAAAGAVNGFHSANGTNRGYVDVLYGVERDLIPNLQLRNFACGGETTTSMIEGGNPTCGYVRSSQLGEALAFVRAHAGEIAFVTIDIGANDLLAGGGVPEIAANLPQILAMLRGATGPTVPVVGMNYYDPFVAPVWFGTHDLDDLQAEVDGVVGFNDFLETLYGLAGMAVADVETAFSVTDLTVQPNGLPLNVRQACVWTWICSAGDVHPNDAGYRTIAEAFLAVLGP